MNGPAAQPTMKDVLGTTRALATMNIIPSRKATRLYLLQS